MFAVRKVLENEVVEKIFEADTDSDGKITMVRHPCLDGGLG